MKIGVMNAPFKNVYTEVEWIGKNGFHYVDLTVEAEKAKPGDIDTLRLKKLLRKQDLDIVGHMGDWYFQKDARYESIRRAVRHEMISAIRKLAALGAKKVTIHGPEQSTSDIQLSLKRHSALVRDCLAEARKRNVILMMENNGESYFMENHRFLFDELMERFPRLRFHLDVGHANIGVKKNVMSKYLKLYKDRLVHVHFSDNDGDGDAHYALGMGSINWPTIVRTLKRHKYDDTITLEIFRPKGAAAKLKSKKTLERLWARCK